VKVIDLVGKILLQINTSNPIIDLNMSDFKTGAYFLVCRNNKEAISTTKIIVK
jgi:hypothetical protein